jgi:cytochrome c
MKKFIGSVVTTATVFGLTAVTAAAATGPLTYGSEAEAIAMVNRAVALVKTAGAENAYRTFTENPEGSFKDRDLYIWVYDFNGNCLAHGANAKMVSKNLLDLKDPDGKELIKGEIDVVKTQGAGWYGPFKFSNPVNHKIENKKAYCARGAGDTMVCSGIYSAQ